MTSAIRSSLCAAVIGASLFFSALAVAQEGDAARGAKLFRERCASCHHKGKDARGPNLTDIVGSTPTDPNFKYKSAMAFMSWVWTADRIDRFLQEPTEVSGANPASRVRNKKQRADIIAYLQTLKSPEGTPPARERP